jgi:uncharacterized protein YpmS
MTLWKQIRFLFLAVTLVSVVFVFVKVLQTTMSNKPKSDQPKPETNSALFSEDLVCLVSPNRREYKVIYPYQDNVRNVENIEGSQT